MEVRITFRSEIYIKGETAAEVRDKFESIPLYSDEALKHHIDFVELVSVEDADTNEDLEHIFLNAYETEQKADDMDDN